MKVELGPKELFFRDEITGFTLHRFGTDKHIAEIPAHEYVEFNHDALGLHGVVSNHTLIKRALSTGTIIPADEDAQEFAESPVREVKTKDIQAIDELRRTADRLLNKMNVNQAKVLIRQVKDLALLEMMATMEVERDNPRSTIMSELRKRMRNKAVRGVGLIQVEELEEPVEELVSADDADNE